METQYENELFLTVYSQSLARLTEEVPMVPCELIIINQHKMFAKFLCRELIYNLL